MEVYIENNKFYSHIVYTFETIMRCIHVSDIQFHNSQKYKAGDNQVYYGKCRPQGFNGIYIKESRLFTALYLSDESMPTTPLLLYGGTPILYGSEDGDKPNIYQKEGVAEINFDIVQSSFFCITGYEEIVLRDKPCHDIHSRYKNENRLLYREGYVYTPVVNEYACILKKCMEKLNFNVTFHIHAAYGHISHDVDNPYSEKNRIILRINNRLGRRMNLNVDMGFNTIIETEKKYNICSSWYFVSGSNNAGYDYRYCLKDMALQHLICTLREKGDEIGWHYSYNAAFDSIQARHEYWKYCECIGEKPLTGRNHYLRYEIPESWNWYAQLDMKYDATLGSAQHEGFIYGICTPFQLFDAVKGHNLGVWEIPLIVMDGTLCEEKYRGMSTEESIETVSELVDIVKKYNGVFSILWHNSSLNNGIWKKWKKTYFEIMKLLGENLECLTGKEIIKRIAD